MIKIIHITSLLTLFLFSKCSSEAKAVANDPEVAGTSVKKGNFSGANGYSVAGSMTIKQTSSGAYVLTLESDFKSSASGNLDIYLSSGSAVTNPHLYLADLTIFEGRQNFEIPSGNDPTTFSHVVIHCASVNLPFGAAELQNP